MRKHSFRYVEAMKAIHHIGGTQSQLLLLHDLIEGRSVTKYGQPVVYVDESTTTRYLYNFCMKQHRLFLLT